MPTIHLTDAAINKATKEAKANQKRADITDSAQPGLRMRIGKSGTREWNLACRDSLGKFRLFQLGAYPGMGISDAREAARAMREKIRAGDDPVAEKRRAKALGVAGQVSTLAELLEAYTAADAAPKSWSDSEKRVKGVFAGLLQQPLAKLRAADLQIAADNWHSKASAAFAIRSIRPVLKWGTKRSYLGRDLLDLEAKTLPPRERVITQVELQKILITLESSKSQYAKATRFMIWTLCRRSEATNARWADVDLQTGVWTIPDTKNGKRHVLKLPSQVTDFLHKHKPKSSKPEELVFPNEEGKPLANWDRFTKSIQEKSKTDGWHRHDLRRTGATVLGNLNIDPHIIEAALNHAVIHSALSGIYNKSRYFESVAGALQQYADFLDALQSATK